MKETFSHCLAKLARKTEGTVTHLPTKKTIALKKTLNDSQKNSNAISQRKKRKHAFRVVVNVKEYYIHFVTLALVLFLAISCVSLIAGLRPVALADKLTHLDGSPTPGSAPPDQTVTHLKDLGSLQLSYGDKCEQFHTVVNGDKFCWNEEDFNWGARDVTCIYNPDIPNHPALTSLTFKDTSLSLPNAVLNQNTCTDNSTCVSDNRSQADHPDEPIHAHTGGDDIVCGNNACTSISAGGNTDECGDPAGKQLNFDRFSCQMVNTSLKITIADESSIENEWNTTGVAINPTAYDPNGALYLPASKDTAYAPPPTCGSNQFWSCAPKEGVIPSLVVYQANFNFSIQDGQKQLAPLVVPFGSSIPALFIQCSPSDGGWAFPCSDQDATKNYGGGMPMISGENKTQSLDHGQVSENFIANDWLSGNAKSEADEDDNPRTRDLPQSGHLVHTYLKDTVAQSGIQKLSPYMLALGFALILPVLVLIGYQFLWASWTLGRANAMETLGRMILSIMGILASYQLASTLIFLINLFNIAIVDFHKAVPYTDVTIGSQTSTFTLKPQGEDDPLSFRGVVVPISRWGCIANDFVALVANKFWTDLSGFIPFFGGITKFIGNIFNVIDVAHHIGEFIVLLLSINLCTQVFTRIVLLNYYVLMGPVAFGCWGLPGGVGQKVVSSWTKGFLTLLFSQTAQVFVLTTFPLILPAFPNLPADRFGLLNTVFEALPRVLVLIAVIQVPKVMGTGATKAIAQAGTVAAGAVAAAGAAAMNAV
jgi:hypothetical protein